MEIDSEGFVKVGPLRREINYNSELLPSLTFTAVYKDRGRFKTVAKYKGLS